MGGMSEFSMMTEGVPWPLAYSLLVVAMVMIGALTYYGLRLFERRSAHIRQAANRRAE
jgi:magnesium transporter